jgi:hypothetical protein
MATIKTKYELLKQEVTQFIKALTARKSIVACMYKASEAPEKLVPNAPPVQFNVLEVRHLITQVMTAEKLGYQTLLTANANELFVNHVEKVPSIPLGLRFIS